MAAITPLQIVQKPSPNVYASRGAYKVLGMAMHAQQGFESGTDLTFLNRASQSSSDYSVARKPPADADPSYPYGETHQYAAEGQVSWACGLPDGIVGGMYYGWNDCVHKIMGAPGHSSYMPQPNGPKNPNYPLAPFYIEGTNPNWYTKSIEFEGFGCDVTYGTGPNAVTYKATGWEDCQYEAGAWLIAFESKRHGFVISGQTIVRHSDLYVPKAHKCPGDVFDMKRIITRAQYYFSQM